MDLEILGLRESESPDCVGTNGRRLPSGFEDNITGRVGGGDGERRAKDISGAPRPLTGLCSTMIPNPSVTTCAFLALARELAVGANNLDDDGRPVFDPILSLRDIEDDADSVPGRLGTTLVPDPIRLTAIGPVLEALGVILDTFGETMELVLRSTLGGCVEGLVTPKFGVFLGFGGTEVLVGVTLVGATDTYGTVEACGFVLAVDLTTVETMLFTTLAAPDLNKPNLLVGFATGSSVTSKVSN